MNTAPIIIGQTRVIPATALETLHGVGIHRKRNANRRVTITQHAAAGTSFVFFGEEKEFHIPARIVPEIFG